MKRENPMRWLFLLRIGCLVVLLTLLLASSVAATTLTVALPSWAQEKWQEIVDDYTRAHARVDVQLIALPPEALIPVQAEEDCAAGRGRFDVLMLYHSWVCSSPGCLEDLSSHEAELIAEEVTPYRCDGNIIGGEFCFNADWIVCVSIDSSYKDLALELLVAATRGGPVVTFELGEPQLALNLEVWEEDESWVFYSVNFPPEGLKTIRMALGGDPSSAELPLAWAQLGWEGEGLIEASAEVAFWIPLGYEDETQARATLQFASSAVRSPRKVKDYLAGVGSNIKGHITGKAFVIREDKLEMEYTLEWEESFKSYTFKGTIAYKEWKLTFKKTRAKVSISTDIPDQAFPIKLVGLSITKKDGQYLMSGKASLPFKTLSEKTPGVLVWDLDEQVVELNIRSPSGRYYEVMDRDGNVKCSIKVSGLRFDLKEGKCQPISGRLEMSGDEYQFCFTTLLDEYTAELSSKKHPVKLSVKGRTKDGKITSVSTSAEFDKLKLEVTAKSLDKKDKDIKATVAYKDESAKVAVTYEKKGSDKKNIRVEVMLKPDANTEITLSAERKIRIKGCPEATRNGFSIAVTQQVELSPNIKMQAELRIRCRDGQGNLPPSIQIPDGTGPILKAEITKQRGIKRPWFAIFLFWTWKF
jgi:hypothetical protein